MVRNFVASLTVSLGVPMINAGDELGRTQGGNNNAYCQDNEVSWIAWEQADASTLAFFRHVLRLRRAAVLRRRTFFSGGRPAGSRMHDLQWLHPDGRELSPADWSDPQTRAFGMLLGGEAIAEHDAAGHPIVGETFLALFNASPAPVRFQLPAMARAWARIIDTRGADTQAVPLPPEQRSYELVPRSLAVLWMTATHSTQA